MLWHWSYTQSRSNAELWHTGSKMWSLSQVKYLQFFIKHSFYYSFFFYSSFFYFHEIHVNGNISLIYITRDKPFARIYLECKFFSFQEKCCRLNRG